MNMQRARHCMPASTIMFLPSGTTSNEALHHEVNVWFRETPHMHQVRRPSGGPTRETTSPPVPMVAISLSFSF